MNQKNNFDEIDKILFDYFENEEEQMPDYVQELISNTMKKIQQQKNNDRFVYIKKIAIIIISFGILTTSMVFAKEVIHYISSLFTNNTEAINTAVQNDYVQELDIDYVYDKDIGVTLDYILLDDNNLALSIVYKYDGNKLIDEIIIDDFKIKGDNQIIIWKKTKGIRNFYTEGAFLSTTSNGIKISENMYKDSLLITSKQFSEFNNIILEINSLKIKENGEYKNQNGKWILEAKIDNVKLNREKLQYYIEYNKYIKDSQIDITETSLNVLLNFNIELDRELISDTKGIILKDTREKEYNYKILKYDSQTLYLEYDMSKFLEDIDNFKLSIRISKDEIIELKLNK